MAHPLSIEFVLYSKSTKAKLWVCVSALEQESHTPFGTGTAFHIKRGYPHCSPMHTPRESSSCAYHTEWRSPHSPRTCSEPLAVAILCCAGHGSPRSRGEEGCGAEITLRAMSPHFRSPRGPCPDHNKIQMLLSRRGGSKGEVIVVKVQRKRGESLCAVVFERSAAVARSRARCIREAVHRV